MNVRTLTAMCCSMTLGWSEIAEAQVSLTTLFTSNNGGSPGGAVYFDVSVLNAVVIQALDANAAAAVGTPVGLQVWLGPYPALANASNPSAWSLVAQDAGGSYAQGIDQPTSFPLSTPISLSPGTYALALVLGNAGHRYTNGNGSNQQYSDANLALQLGGASSVPFAGTLFQPRVWNGTVHYATSGNPSNDECSGAVLVANGWNGPYTNAAATTSAPWPCGLGANDVWYAYTATCDGMLGIQTCGQAGFDTTLEVLVGSCPGLVSIACNDDQCALQSRVDVPAVASASYWIRVGGYAGATGSFSLHFDCVSHDPPPVIHSVAPPVVACGGSQFRLAVRGSSFSASSIVRWNGAALSAYALRTPARIEVDVPAALIAQAARASIDVFTPAPGGGTSAARGVLIARPHAIEVISANAQCTGANGESVSPAISTDGRFVAFASLGTNLDGLADGNGAYDIFVRDRADEETRRISTSAAGGVANGGSHRPALSSDGRYVLFTSTATNLVAGVISPYEQVYRCDRDADDDGVLDEPGATQTILVSASVLGGPGNGPSSSSAGGLSEDGRRAVFSSSATNLRAVPTSNDQAWLRDFAAGTNHLVSATATGASGNGASRGVAISGDGNYAAFHTAAPNLLAAFPSGVDQVLRKYVGGGTPSTGPLALVSRATGASSATGDGASRFPAISRTGQFVAFESDARNLSPADQNGAKDIFRRDFGSSATLLVSFSTQGGSGNGGSHTAAITPTGCTSFVSAASDLTVRDTNLTSDVHSWNSGLPADPPVPGSMYGYPYGSMGSAPSGLGGISAAEGTGAVAFSSLAHDLAMGTHYQVTHGIALILVHAFPFVIASAIGESNPVSFSVNGPVDPHTEGLLFARGTGPASPYAMRLPDVLRAIGLPTPRPGDVRDYWTAGVRSEAELFQSSPDGGGPDGTNNQILVAGEVGLVAGAPGAAQRDNVDAMSFGEDYFGVRGVTPAPAPAATPWPARGIGFALPEVTADVGTSFRFSVDPFATGLADTAVQLESLGFDVSPFPGFWTSPGHAAGDVYATPALTKPGAPAPGLNTLVYDQIALGLAPDAMAIPIVEDDLDALECIGENDRGAWLGLSGPLAPGDLRSRATEIAAGLGLPAVPHHVLDAAPVFFSVDRESTGEYLSAVRTQGLGSEAAGDVYLAFLGTNLLLIDETELGLYPGPSLVPGTDRTDELDALLLAFDHCQKPFVIQLIRDAFAQRTLVDPTPAQPSSGDERYTGPGYTESLLRFSWRLHGSAGQLRIRVGFSVSTDSIGLEGTAVDFQAGLKPTMEQSGDIFFTQFGAWADLPSLVNPAPASPLGTNWLWYEEIEIGLDKGAWALSAVPATSLAVLPDELNALDSICSMPYYGGSSMSYGSPTWGTGSYAPVLTATGWMSLGRSFAFTVHHALGGAPGLLALSWGQANLRLQGPTGELPILFDPARLVLALPFVTSSGGAGAGELVWRLALDPSFQAFDLAGQALILDPQGSSSLGVSSTNGVGIRVR